MVKIEVYDDPKTFDRYTVAIDDYVFAMSENPLSPLGFNQFAGTKNMLPNWKIGKKVSLKKLPKDVKEAILQRVKDSSERQKLRKVM